jgi:hypothetical protein
LRRLPYWSTTPEIRPIREGLPVLELLSRHQ